MKLDKSYDQQPAQTLAVPFHASADMEDECGDEEFWSTFSEAGEMGLSSKQPSPLELMDSEDYSLEQRDLYGDEDFLDDSYEVSSFGAYQPEGNSLYSKNNTKPYPSKTAHTGAGWSAPFQVGSAFEDEEQTPQDASSNSRGFKKPGFLNRRKRMIDEILDVAGENSLNASSVSSKPSSSSAGNKFLATSAPMYGASRTGVKSKQVSLPKKTTNSSSSRAQWSSLSPVTDYSTPSVSPAKADITPAAPYSSYSTSKPAFGYSTSFPVKKNVPPTRPMKESVPSNQNYSTGRPMKENVPPTNYSTSRPMKANIPRTSRSLKENVPHMQDYTAGHPLKAPNISPTVLSPDYATHSPLKAHVPPAILPSMPNVEQSDSHSAAMPGPSTKHKAYGPVPAACSFFTAGTTDT